MGVVLGPIALCFVFFTILACFGCTRFTLGGINRRMVAKRAVRAERRRRDEYEDEEFAIAPISAPPPALIVDSPT